MTNLSEAVAVLRDTGTAYPAVLTPDQRLALLTFHSDVEAAYQRMIDTPMSEDSTRDFMDGIEDALWPLSADEKAGKRS